MKKKTLIFSLISFVLFGAMTNLHAKSETEKVLTEKTFTVNANAELVINHEFGTLECKNWDKNEIYVQIIARVESDNSEKVTKALNRVKYDLSGNSDRVAVTCTLDDKGNSGKHTSISIDVMVMMPRDLRLDVKHKFGSGYIDEVDGPSKVVSEYGSMTIEGLNSPESKLKIAFGEGTVNRFGGGSIQISYSKFSLEETSKVTVNSEYSDINIEKMDQGTINAEGGDVTIGKADKISGSSEFGSMKIDWLGTSLDVKTEYGSLVVKDVSSEFTDISVRNSFGSTKLFISEDASYQFDAEAEYGSIDYPEEMADLSYREKSMHKMTYRGVIGKGGTADATVQLSSEYGSIQVIAN